MSGNYQIHIPGLNAPQRFLVGDNIIYADDGRGGDFKEINLLEAQNKINDIEKLALALMAECEKVKQAIVNIFPDKMVMIDGKSYRCECGGNVFKEYQPCHFRCNSCEVTYSGER